MREREREIRNIHLNLWIIKLLSSCFNPEVGDSAIQPWISPKSITLFWISSNTYVSIRFILFSSKFWVLKIFLLCLTTALNDHNFYLLLICSFASSPVCIGMNKNTIGTIESTDYPSKKINKQQKKSKYIPKQKKTFCDWKTRRGGEETVKVLWHYTAKALCFKISKTRTLMWEL